MEPDKTPFSRTTDLNQDLTSQNLNSITLNRKFRKLKSIYSGKNLTLIDGVPLCLPTVSTPDAQTCSIPKPYMHIKKYSLHSRLRGKSFVDDSLILKSTTLQSSSPEIDESLRNDRYCISPTNASRSTRSRPRIKLSSPKQLERLFNRHFIKRISPKPRPQFPSITSRSDTNRTYEVTGLKSSINMRKVVKPPSSGGFIIKPCITIISAQVSRR